MKQPNVLTLTFGILVALPSLTQAQWRSQDPLPSQVQCDNAAASIGAGAPTDKELTTILGCPSQRGSVLATYLQVVKTSSDTSVLKTAFQSAFTIREVDWYTATRSIAGDGSASANARVMSMWVLINYELPRGTSSSWRTISMGSGAEGCTPAEATSGQVLNGPVALPFDHSMQDSTLAAQVIASGAPTEVRSAAQCLLGASKDWTALPPYTTPVIYPPVNTSLLTLASVCGNTFVIRNANPLPITVHYDVTSTAETGIFGLPPKPSGLSYSETGLTVQHTGTVRILFQGSVVASGPAPGSSCVTPPPPVPAWVSLHGMDNAGTQVTFLDFTASNNPDAKYKSAPALQFSGGNPWREVATWSMIPPLRQIVAANDAILWLGLPSSSDQGAKFDLRVELYFNTTLIASGESRCIQGIVSNPNNALQQSVTIGTLSTQTFNGTSDVLSLKVLTRMGTNQNGNSCSGPTSASGLRVYFDAATRRARFRATM